MASPWTAVPPPGMSAPYGYPPGVSTAYYPVQVRQSFAQPMPMQYPLVNHSPALPPPPPPPTAAPKKKVDWPPAVRLYVQRSFDPANMIPSVTRPEMEAKLKETIAAAAEQDFLLTLDWSTLQLPQAMIVAERKAQSVSQQTTHLMDGVSLTKSSKKRKSQEMAAGDDNTSQTPPPWQTTSSRNDFEDRLTFRAPQPEGSNKHSKLNKNLEKRQRRFDGGYKSTYVSSPEPPQTVGPVVGTSQDLEKQYFRLTAPPIPSKVRPEAILQQTLELLKKKWRKEGNYSYICDQFKSMRQDLTVQRIRNEFTVTVYEIHARIALEKGDLGEYNQCQTQLKALYKMHLGGNPTEFKAYRILYFIHTANRTALNDMMADLTQSDKVQPAIKHALDVRSALNTGNYHRFFRLYLDTPNMGAYLMDMFVNRERLTAITKICKSYKPDVRLRFITEELGFESDQDAAQFVLDNNGQSMLVEKGDELRFTTSLASASLFEAARSEAFRKIDIKGQI